MRPIFFAFLLAFSINALSADQCQYLLLKFLPASYFNLDLQKNDAELLIKKASENVGEAEKVQQLENLLLSIKNGNRISASSNQYIFLKAFRKEVSIFKNAMMISTVNHSVPKKFSSFVKELGILNDLFAMKDHQNISEQADRVLSLLKKVDFSELTKDLKYSSKKDLAVYFKDLKKEIKRLYIKNKITVDEFHEIRKLLKEYLNYFQLKNLEAVNQEKLIAERFFYDLSEQLGEINDQFSYQILRGEIQSSDKVKLPDSAREKIKFLIEDAI